MKEWVSPVYAFFDPTPRITEGCKATIQHLDKKDVQSTGNMCKHSKSCWGEDMLNAADNAKDVNENGSIIAFFMCKGEEKVTYSYRQHTHGETRAEIVHWVSENLCPFEILLTKTGRC
ncbi:hypothetical protein BD769DRAFT_1625594 [Suillus cothurnatus]|nr:hypothetical protein BD769DRAFT_1625594 [Suillus cothurnatus]